MLAHLKAGRTRATLWRHTVASVCGKDVVSHRFPLFRCQTVHTSVRGELLLTPTTACRGCVARTRAHERLWMTDGDVASSSKSMHKLRTCGALQSGVALPIHTGDSVARLIQDTDTLNKLQCGATALRTQSLLCARSNTVYISFFYCNEMPVFIKF